MSQTATETPTKTTDTQAYSLDELPDNTMGRKLNAQREIAKTVEAVAHVLNTDEARSEVLRVLRFLGYAPKTKRGPKPKTEPAAPTVTGTATAAQTKSGNVVKPVIPPK